MASLAELTVDLSVNTAALRKGLDDAKGHLESFGQKVEGLVKGVVALEAVKLAMEGVKKAGEFMEQGIKDATSLGNGPARELGETLEKAGLATRQLGANLMSDLAPAFNSLISWFTQGADLGKILTKVAEVLGQAFRDLVKPLVAVAGAIKGFAEGGTLESALGGAITAMDKLAEHGEAFAGSLKTAQQIARQIAEMQLANTDKNIDREAARSEAQFANLTGNRRQDKFAGATEGFSGFENAIGHWVVEMKAAADLTRLAADAETYHQQIAAEAYRLEADQHTQLADKAKLAADGFRMMKEKLIVDTQAINNIHFNLGESVSNIGRNAGIRTQQFNNTFNPTKGFENFGDALAKQTKALENQAGLLAAGEIIQQQFGAAAQGTVLALKAQADQEGRNAEAAKEAADAFFAVKDRIRDQLVGGLQVAGDAFLSKIGQLGTVINDAIKGFQQGGIWGALAALIMDLLSMMDGWKDIQNLAQGQLMMALKDMSSGLNSVIGGLKPLMGAVESIAQAFHGVLNPILGLVGKLLKGIAPIIELVGIALQNIGSSLAPVFQIIGAIITPILKALEPILRAVALVFIALKLSTDLVSLAFNKVIDDLFHQNAGGVLDATKSVVDDLAQMQDVATKGLDGVAAASADSAEAMGATANAANGAAKSLSKFSENLSNVPSGFRIALRTYQSMQAAGAHQLPGGGAAVVHIDKLTVAANSMTELYDQLLKLHRRNSFNGGGG